MRITIDNPMAVDGTMLKMLTTMAEAPRGEAPVAVAKLWDQERLAAINSEPPALHAAIGGLRRTSLMEDDHIAATKMGRLIVELRRSWNPSAVMMPEGNTATATAVTDAYAFSSTNHHRSTIFIRADHWSLGAWPSTERAAWEQWSDDYLWVLSRDETGEDRVIWRSIYANEWYAPAVLAGSQL